MKTESQIRAWVKTHGIERGTAAQIFGYLRGKGVALSGGIELCQYGLTYSFDEFCEWFENDDDSLVPHENEYAIFWDKNKSAVIAVYDRADPEDKLWIDTFGRAWDNACKFESMAQYRMILNTPEGERIDLPLSHLSPEYNAIVEIESENTCCCEEAVPDSDPYVENRESEE